MEGKIKGGSKPREGMKTREKGGGAERATQSATIEGTVGRMGESRGVPRKKGVILHSGNELRVMGSPQTKERIKSQSRCFLAHRKCERGLFVLIFYFIWPQTLYPPASASQMLGLQGGTCHNTQPHNGKF
jgi:hypothetical protein